MALAAIRLLIINRQLDFAVSVKRGLEQIGGFEVVSFTTAGTAFEYLNEHPQDVALVDFTLPDMPGADIVLRLRSIQPDVGVIASPNTDQIAAIVHDLDLQGIVDVPCSIRELTPIVQNAVRQMHDMLPDTARSEPVSGDSDTLHIDLPSRPEAVDRRLPAVDAESDDSFDVSESIEIVLDDTPQKESKETASRKTFERLAQEEPPAPSLEESGTVGDLVSGVRDEENLDDVLSILGDQEPVDVDSFFMEGIDDDEEDSDSPARMVLITALDETQPLGDLSLETLLSSIQQQLPKDEGGVRPLPSWVQESELYVREPDFLPEELPSMETGEYASDTTRPSSMQKIEDKPEELDTDIIDPIVRSRPPRPDELPELEREDFDVVTEKAPPTLPEVEAAPPEVIEDDEPASVSAEAEVAPDDVDEAEVVAEPAAKEAPVPEQVTAGVDSEDPYVAQLALSLTQVSLELAAEATLLAREGRIVAYAGTLPFEDVDDIRDAVSNDWQADPKQARIRFITLPSSGEDYMLYSRRTDGNLTLSMIFAGNQPLNKMRSQSDRLLEALWAVPEKPETAVAVAEPEKVETPELIDAGPLTLYTFVWLTRDPDHIIDNRMAQSIVMGLDVQLTRGAWDITTLNVHEDYVYLLAGVPGEAPAHEIVHDVMRRSAEMVHGHDKSIDPDTFWADSYMVLAPGRELDIEEIQRFINFVRMA